MSKQLCRKCGEPGFFRKSATICDDCWHTYDMGRFEEVRPKKGERPTARAANLSHGGLGIICPHCDHKIMRKANYYHRAVNTERCPRCMEHYLVKPKEAI